MTPLSARSLLGSRLAVRWWVSDKPSSKNRASLLQQTLSAVDRLELLLRWSIKLSAPPSEPFKIAWFVCASQGTSEKWLFGSGLLLVIEESSGSAQQNGVSGVRFEKFKSTQCRLHCWKPGFGACLMHRGCLLISEAVCCCYLVTDLVFAAS